MIETLNLHHVRGLQEASLVLAPQINLWIGDNGAGKTSVLEAVSVLSYGRSFVTPRHKALIAHAADQMTVFAKVARKGVPHRLATQITRSGDRRLRFDGGTARGQSVLSRALPVLVIAPHMPDLITGSPGDRRRWMDWGAFHCLSGDASVFAALRRALLQRNTGLRSGTLKDCDLDAWDQQIDVYGHQVDSWRQRFVDEIQAVFPDVLARLGFAGQVQLDYQRGWSEKPLVADLLSHRVRDRKARQTQVGPQRADLVFRCDDQRAADVLSRGQLKTVNLALILAQLRVANAREIQPVLCLDDPGAELDLRFQRAVWAEVLSHGCQTLVTGIDEQRAGLSADAQDCARVFHVKHGAIHLVKEA